MVSLRQIARCIGIADGFRVLEDFFGYVSIPSNAPTGSLSLWEQVDRIGRRHIHLNLIRVSIEDFTRADEEEIDYALQSTRDLYATVNLGIGRVQRCFITRVQANGREYIDNHAEAEALTHEWTVPNDALDVFFVRTYAGDTVGYSAVYGPCDKDTWADLNGSVVAIADVPNTHELTAAVLAHEVGHYLGLTHSPDPDNLMHDEVPTPPRVAYLTSDQGAVMRQHCFVHPPCLG